jgi:hypothetical protein
MFHVEQDAKYLVDRWDGLVGVSEDLRRRIESGIDFTSGDWGFECDGDRAQPSKEIDQGRAKLFRLLFFVTGRRIPGVEAQLRTDYGTHAQSRIRECLLRCSTLERHSFAHR